MHAKAVVTILSNKKVLSRSQYQKKNNDYENYITNQANLKTELVL